MKTQRKYRRIQVLLHAQKEKDRVIQDFLDSLPKNLDGGHSSMIKSVLYDFILESKNSRKTRKKTIQTVSNHNKSIEKKSIKRLSQQQAQTTNQGSGKQIKNALNSIMAASKEALNKK